jgi:hypothetical protein
MAAKLWRGDAPAVAQIDTLTPGGTIEVGDKFKATINGKTLSYSATGTTVASVTAGFVAAWNALDSTAYPEFAEVTAADTGTSITLTAKTAGKPFSVTVATTESDDSAADAQTFTRAATTASSGPNHWDAAANWSPAGVPANGDEVYFENSDVDALYGLDQSAVTLASLNVAASFSGSIGLPNHTGSYFEYREKHLKIGATTANIGAGEGSGSGRLKLNTLAVQTTLNVFSTGSPAEVGLEALLWIGTHASNQMTLSRGSVGAAVEAGQTATLATLRVGFDANQSGEAAFRGGSGLTLTTLEQASGTVELNAGVTTVNKSDGTLLANAGNVTTLTNDGGTVYYAGAGTLATVHVGDQATLDFTRNLRARTVTTCNLHAGGTIRDPHKTATWTNGIALVRAGLPDVELDVGSNRTLTVA